MNVKLIGAYIKEVFPLATFFAAYVHWYEKYGVDEACFEAAFDHLNYAIQSYKDVVPNSYVSL